jgi:hypothetical protein
MVAALATLLRSTLSPVVKADDVPDRWPAETARPAWCARRAKARSNGF